MSHPRHSDARRKDARQRTSSAGMSATQARTLEFGIIGLCLVALTLVFQPFSLELYGVGAVLVIVGGLAFNLVPFCRTGVPLQRVLRVAMIVIVTLLIITAIAITSAWLYGKFFVGSA